MHLQLYKFFIIHTYVSVAFCDHPQGVEYKVQGIIK